jgi:DNA-binding response OmpR family regulator
MPRGQATPIVGTTAGRDRAECIAAGMNDLMPKPFQIEKLRLILSRWTSWTDQKNDQKKCDCQADSTTGVTPRDSSRPGW